MPSPSPGALLDPGIELASPAPASGFFTTGATREASVSGIWLLSYPDSAWITCRSSAENPSVAAVLICVAGLISGLPCACHPDR